MYATICLQKILASIFIVSMGTLLLFWCLPKEYIMRKILHKLFARYIIWCGLDNYWALFAPHPPSKNFIISFEVQFSDGSTKPWEIMELKLKDQFQVIDKTRYLKWYIVLLSQTDEICKEALCKYILKEFQKTNKNQTPEQINIIKHYETPNHLKILGMPWLSYIAFSFKV